MLCQKYNFRLSDACDGSVATQDVRSRCNFEPESDPIHNFESEPIHDFRRRIVGPVFAKIVWWLAEGSEECEVRNTKAE